MTCHSGPLPEQIFTPDLWSDLALSVRSTEFSGGNCSTNGGSQYLDLVHCSEVPDFSHRLRDDRKAKYVLKV